MGAGTGACWFNWSISSILAMKYELKPPSAITEIHVPGTVPLLPTLTLGIPRVHPLLLPASLIGTCNAQRRPQSALETIPELDWMLLPVSPSLVGDRYWPLIFLPQLWVGASLQKNETPNFPCQITSIWATEKCTSPLWVSAPRHRVTAGPRSHSTVSSHPEEVQHSCGISSSPCT